MFRFFFISVAFAASVVLGSDPPESLRKTAPGIASLRLLAEKSAVRPGDTVGIGIEFELEEGFHTYWRGPGIVGVAPIIDWTLPEGVEAGSFHWPPPEKVDMAGLVANGYHDRVMLVADFRIAEDRKPGPLEINAKISWMVCSDSCHPGNAEFSLSIPVAEKDSPLPKGGDRTLAFDAVRDSVPLLAPSDWEARLISQTKDEVVIELTIPNFGRLRDSGTSPEVQFFCDDLQIDSDEPARFSWAGEAGDRFRLTLVPTTFAPKNSETLSGLVYLDEDWPGTEDHYVRVSIPLPRTSTADE